MHAAIEHLVFFVSYFIHVYCAFVPQICTICFVLYVINLLGLCAFGN